jgi:hypothetical protein
VRSYIEKEEKMRSKSIAHARNSQFSTIQTPGSFDYSQKHKVAAHDRLGPHKIDPSKELVINVDRGSPEMENKFIEKFTMKRQADLPNIDYKYPHQEMAEFMKKVREEKEKANQHVLDIMY